MSMDRTQSVHDLGSFNDVPIPMTVSRRNIFVYKMIIFISFHSTILATDVLGELYGVTVVIVN